MSTVLFHSFRQPEVAIHGSEGMKLVNDTAHCAFGLVYQNPVLHDVFFRPGAWWCESKEACRDVFTGGFLMGREKVLPNGRTIQVQEVILNTALGCDQHRLAARIAAQFELWPYIEGPNRAWFADMIEGHLADGRFRPAMGWEQAIAFLRKTDKHPVILSGQITDRPPRSGRWTWFMDRQRQENQIHVKEFRPEGWETFRVGSKLDLETLSRELSGERQHA